MRQLYRLFGLFREYIILALLSSVSIILVVQNDSTPVQVLRSVAITVFSGIQSIPGAIAGIVSPQSQTDMLRDVNMRLMEEVMQLRHLQFENKELRSMLDFREKFAHPLLPAEIVGKGGNRVMNTITLNVGSDDSVAVRMPVINEQGLVGKVIAVSSHFCVVQTALSREFRVTAKVARTRIDGIIASENNQTLLMQNIWKTADVAQGDTVVTSEYSNIFPPNIPIGTISTIGVGPTGLFSRVDVTPFTDFNRLERVFVIRHNPDPERAALEHQVLTQEQMR